MSQMKIKKKKKKTCQLNYCEDYSVYNITQFKYESH